MPLTRDQIAQSTGIKLAAAAPTLKSVKAAVGLDGFVDEIIAVVDKRHDKDRYDPLRTIAALGQKISRAAGESSNYELIVKQTKLGGNGPIMANALAAIGLDVTYIGNLGYPVLHPVFEPMAKHAHVISIAEPGHTDALEFDDGKIMLGKHQSLKDINWANLLARVGKEKLKGILDGASLIGMVNWTMLPFMSDIWKHLLAEMIPGGKKDRTLFVDLADPEKRTPDDIREALGLLTQFQQHVNVTLGLNLKESTEVTEVLGLPHKADAEGAIEQTAQEIRAKLKLSCVVVHPRKGAAAATENATASFAGPFVQQPKISTGAGDHFNSGFCLGRLLGFGLEECLCTGVATSGYYVRSAESPSAAALAEFIGKLPGAEGSMP